MIRTLETHLVDATVLTSRTYSLGLQQTGFTVLAEVTTGDGLNRDRHERVMEKHPAMIVNAMKALIEGEYYTLAPGGKLQVIKTQCSGSNLPTRPLPKRVTLTCSKSLNSNIARRAKKHAAPAGDAKSQARRP
jgi:hypothetical protein